MELIFEDEKYIDEEFENLVRAKLNVLDERLELIDSDPKSDKQESYMIHSMRNMYDILLKNHQYGDSHVGTGGKVVHRLIRCKRYIPNYVLSSNDVTEDKKVVFGAMYMTVPMYIFPEKSYKEVIKATRGTLVNPELYGLLPHSDVNYGSVQIHNGFCTAIMKNCWQSEWINRCIHYEYVALDH